MPAKTKAAPARMPLKDAMAALEKAGSAQTRKTYARHGGAEPMFGVSFAFQKTMVKRIGVDQELAEKLWETRNLDARILAMKVADPATIKSAVLDRWAGELAMRMCGGYLSCLASEGPHAKPLAEAWLASKDATKRVNGWDLVGAMALRDEATPDAWFGQRLAVIETSIHAAPNAEREQMNGVVISIGCRSAALRKAAEAAAKRIGKVEIDHGDTECKTRDAREYIAKAWAHSTSKGFESPAAHERSREPMRTRC